MERSEPVADKLVKDEDEETECEYEVYQVITSVGSSYFGATQFEEAYMTFTTWERAAEHAFKLASEELAKTRAQMIACNRHECARKHWMGEAEKARWKKYYEADYPETFEKNEAASYVWGGECDTGPRHAVYVAAVQVYK